MQPSSIYSPLSSFSEASPVPHELAGDHYLWELLHDCDRHERDSPTISQKGLGVLERSVSQISLDPIVGGSPDWVFVCDEWNPRLNAALIFRDSQLVAAIQKDAGNLKLVTFGFLSARLIEALFELGVDARVESEIGELFWKRVETVSWRHGLGTLGYTLESFSSEVSVPSQIDEKADRLISFSRNALPNAFAARQLRILYKYG
ncbi:hypothetical protein N9X40_00155 [bacterium]|nr:hypothetical protein [bacterium]